MTVKWKYLDRNDIHVSNFDIVAILGSGGFGTCYKAKYKGNLEVCLKRINRTSKTKAALQSFNAETKQEYYHFEHPNIVRFREVYKTKKGKLCIVMDFADGGDL